MKKFKFAIMGAGGISNQFCDAVSRLESCEIIAVASKSLERARIFAERNHINTAYGSYKEMLEEERPDCVYIGVLPNSHYELSMLCLDYNIPVLCEKAMFMNSRQAEEVFKRSREQNVFVMEALWSRFLPAVKKAKSWVEEGRIGKPQFCDTAIGFIAPEGKDNRYYNADLGGGAARDILVYAFELTTYMLTDPIEDIQVSVIWGDTGVDLTDHVMLHFHDAVASLTTSFAAPIEERMVIYGTEGKIILPNPHFAGEVFLYDKDKKQIEYFKDEQTENGFTYEIQETVKCILAGETESCIVPQKSTLDCARLFDMIEESRRQ